MTVYVIVEGGSDFIASCVLDLCIRVVFLLIENGMGGWTKVDGVTQVDGRK